MSTFSQMVTGAAAAIGISITAGTALAEDTDQHPCQDIATTTDVAQCIETAVAYDDLFEYLEVVNSSAGHQDVYSQVNGEETCQYLVNNSTELGYYYRVTTANPGQELHADTISQIELSVKGYFENAAACYGQSLDLYSEAGLTGHEEALSAMQNAAQSAADAIQLDDISPE